MESSLKVFQLTRAIPEAEGRRGRHRLGHLPTTASSVSLSCSDVFPPASMSLFGALPSASSCSFACSPLQILQTRLSDGETSRREPLFLSASWTYSNSARENCAWNVLTVAAASLKTWRDALEEVLRQIGSLCDYGIEQAELNWIIRSLRKCYRWAGLMYGWL